MRVVVVFFFFYHTGHNVYSFAVVTSQDPHTHAQFCCVDSM